MASLCVRTAQTTGYNAAGETMFFDFSGDVAPGSQILAYGVGLAGFALDYNPNSMFWAENMGHMQVALVPQMMDNVVIAQGNALLSDYEEDSAGSPRGMPATRVQATALCLVGPANGIGTNVLGSVFGVPSNSALPNIAARTNQTNLALLSGFNLMASAGGEGEIASFNVQVSQSVGGGVLGGSVAASVGDLATSATVDVLMMSLSGSGQTAPVSASWNALDDKDVGITGTLAATFTLPSGNTLKSSNVGLILQSLKIRFESDSHEFEIVSGMITGGPAITISGAQATVTWQYALNIYNPDAFVMDSYISSNINFTAYAVAQFTPS